jgi:beta-glucosidase
MVLAVACGHSAQVLDAYEQSKKGAITSTGGSSNTGGTGNTGTGGDTTTGGSGGTGGSTSGSGGSGTPDSACMAAPSQQFDTAHMQPYSVTQDVKDNVATTLGAMQLADKATQMLGVPVGNMDYQDIERSPDVMVAGKTIRGYSYRDAGKGANLDAGQKFNRDQSDGNNFSTVFPAPSTRAASWDMDMEKKVGEAAGDETAASHNNMLLAPCMNIIRHPYWGRTQETYGEDMYAIGRMATAYTVGLQEYVTGCAKHFMANNIERFRSNQNAIMNEQTLREIYGRHFEMVIQDGGVGCIMASYNKINGTKDTQNKHLLRDILKAPVAMGGMGYQGLVISDWWAMPGDQMVPDTATAQAQTTEALEAGLDIEVPWTLHYSTTTLSSVPDADKPLIDDAAARILTQKFRFKTALDTDGWSVTPPKSTLSGSSIATNMDHEAIAEDMELKSAVLLMNGVPPAAGMPATPVLPLKGFTKIAVVGPDETFGLISSSVPKTCGNANLRGPCTFHFATDANLGDRGSSRVNGDPARSIGPFAGIQMAATGATVTSGNSPDAAMGADAIVVVVGYTPGDEGEEYAISTGGDRSTLDLPNADSGTQNDFVSKVLDLMKPTVIVIESGSIVNLPWLNHANKQQATVWAGYGGLRGGAALGRLIFSPAGENFSGKMPMSWPSQAQLAKQNFKGDTGADDTNTTMGYFFGYREWDRRQYVAKEAVDMVFPFGHGLSYSTFEYSNLTMPCMAGGAAKDAIVNITVDIKNSSAVDGDEVAMLFVKPPPKPAGYTGDRPWKELKSFARVSIKAGATATAVQLPLRIHDLRRWEGDDKTGKWVVDTGDYTIAVGKDAGDAETTTNTGILHVVGDK